MQKCFIQWTQSLVGKIQGVVAIDGKTLRGSGEITSDLDAIHMVSAFATENEIILGQLKTSGKGKELEGIKLILQLIDIEGVTVSIGAGGCHKEVAFTESVVNIYAVTKTVALELAESIKPFFSLPPQTSINVNQSAYNRSLFEEYKTTLRSQMEKPYVIDPKLRGIVEYNYKPHATIGNGSTAAAIRHELATGEKVFNRLHSKKGKETINALEKWLKNHPTAAPGDKATAENIIKDLRNALGE